MEGGEETLYKENIIYDSLMNETTAAEAELAGWKRWNDHCT